MHLLLKAGGRVLATFAVIIVATRMFGAEPASIVTVLHGDADGAVEVVLRASRVGGTATPLERIVTVPGQHRLELPAGNWEVSAQSPLLWSAPSVVANGETVQLDLWPAGFVYGAIRQQRKGAPVDALRALFTSLERGTGAAPDVPPSGEAQCTVEGVKWRCPVPAGRHDLRFVARGYAAEFRWDQQVTARKETNVGMLTMRPGASLHGLVTLARGVTIKSTAVVVTAAPRAAASLPQRRYSSPVDQRGFFQIAGLPAGEYVVRAAAGNLRSEERTVTILEERNAELRAPLIVDTPRTLSVHVSGPREAPPPWHVRLFSVQPGSPMESAAAGMTDDHGAWSAQLPPGDYWLQVGRSETSRWRAVDVTIGAADVDLDVRIPGRLARGTVTLGRTPLAGARLLFGGEQGAEQETLITDGEGKFSGVLPEPGENDDSRWIVTIESDQPRVKRTVHAEPADEEGEELEFEIVLPGTTVTGRAVNEDGSGEPYAIVTLRSADAAVFEQADTQADGTFVLFGFEPGTYRVRAESFKRTSGIVNVEATEGVTAPVQLVLRDEVIVRGKIQSRHTSGVEANLTALQRGTRTDFIPTANSDARGLFELRLPPETRIFDVLVQAPGFATAAGRIVVEDDKFLTITLDQNGGTLSMEFPAGTDPVLRHDGAEFRARWFATVTGGTTETTDRTERATLANLEPGEYTLCLENRCRSGVVTTQGLLVLTVPRD